MFSFMGFNTPPIQHYPLILAIQRLVLNIYTAPFPNISGKIDLWTEYQKGIISTYQGLWSANLPRLKICEGSYVLYALHNARETDRYPSFFIFEGVEMLDLKRNRLCLKYFFHFMT